MAAVRDYNDELSDKDMELDLELLDSLRQTLIDNGVRPEVMEPISDPWPAD